ncbi:anthrone oxygenase family protein [Pseudonocardia sp. TRM90224]|uniref:anthrone oxygenase family protein n=1 Tax=Pseudonocardia sp. TRM90224 TaxID=2812678 RepID=UPI001E4B5116|nr:anthrone oxygenase family protein [Pseudonocardia sp. TRM90224]
MADAGTVLLTIARAANAHWFFGNLYEELVRMPDRLADEHDSGRARLPSPVRYYVPALPALVGGAVAAAVTGRRGPARGALATAAVSTVAGVGLTGFVVRTVIFRLIDDGPPLEQAERERLITRWHRVNRVRLVLAAVAAIAYDRAARGGC